VTFDCDKLDDYLLGDLSDVDARRFEAHLGECNECREAVEEQQWIDGLLQSSAAASLEAAPPTIAESLQRSVAGRRRASLYVAFCLAAAATVAAVALGWTLQLGRDGDDVAAPSANEVVERARPVEEPIAVAPAASKRERATYANDDDTIAIDVESEDDDVTIVQLYPTTETERRAQRELALRPFELELNGG
jgi:anti-sigma factor RsiW